jgi:hypothetical protein
VSNPLVALHVKGPIRIEKQGDISMGIFGNAGD